MILLLLVGIIIMALICADLFSPTSPGPTMTTWKVTKVDGTKYVTCDDVHHINMDDVVSVEEVNL